MNTRFMNVNFFFYRFSSRKWQRILNYRGRDDIWKFKEETMGPNDKTKYDTLTFLKMREEEMRTFFTEWASIRKRILVYLTLKIRVTKSTGDLKEVSNQICMGAVTLFSIILTLNKSWGTASWKSLTLFWNTKREGSN